MQSKRVQKNKAKAYNKNAVCSFRAQAKNSANQAKTAHQMPCHMRGMGQQPHTNKIRKQQIERTQTSGVEGSITQRGAAQCDTYGATGRQRFLEGNGVRVCTNPRFYKGDTAVILNAQVALKPCGCVRKGDTDKEGDGDKGRFMPVKYETARDDECEGKSGGRRNACAKTEQINPEKLKDDAKGHSQMPCVCTHAKREGKHEGSVYDDKSEIAPEKCCTDKKKAPNAPARSGSEYHRGISTAKLMESQGSL